MKIRALRLSENDETVAGRLRYARSMQARVSEPGKAHYGTDLPRRSFSEDWTSLVDEII